MPAPAMPRWCAHALASIAGVEVHAVSDEGKLIVTIESPGDRETADTFEAISEMDHVMSTSMVYHQTESEPEAAVEVAGGARHAATTRRSEMKLTRREFIKSNAVAAAAGVAGMSVPGAQALAQSTRRRHPLGQGRLPLLRHRLRRAGRHQGRSHRGDAGRSRRAGEQGPQLHQGLFPVEDTVRQGSPDARRCCA